MPCCDEMVTMRPRASPTGSWREHLLDGALAAEEHAAQADGHDRVPVVLARSRAGPSSGGRRGSRSAPSRRAARALDGGAHEQVDVAGARGIRGHEDAPPARSAISSTVGRPPSRGSSRTSPTTTWRPRRRSAAPSRGRARRPARDDDRLSPRGGPRRDRSRRQAHPGRWRRGLRVSAARAGSTGSGME